MPVVNMHEAKTHLAELVRRVQQGETFIIARAGRPMAQLTRLGGTPRPRRPGSLAGLVRMDEEVGMPAPVPVSLPLQMPAAGPDRARSLPAVDPDRARSLPAVGGATRDARVLRASNGGAVQCRASARGGAGIARGHFAATGGAR